MTHYSPLSYIHALTTRKYTTTKANRRRAITRPKIEHLQALLRKKEASEARIEECHAQIEHGFTTVSDQFDAAIQQRLEQICAPSTD